MKRKNTGDMTEGAIPAALMRFAVPMVFGLLLQQLYNTVDAAIVGRYVSKEALAAVGSTSSILQLMIGLMNGVSIGAGVVVAQCYGAGDEAGLQRAVRASAAVTLAMGALCMLLGFALVSPLLRLMKTPDDVFEQARKYLSICVLGFPFLFVYHMGAAVLRAVGDAKRPLCFLAAAAVLNTALDLLFIVGFGLGVEGAAVATILSQGVSAVLVAAVLGRRMGISIDFRRGQIDGEIMKRIMVIGLPTALQQMLNAFSSTYVQSYVNAFGADVMAGWSVHAKMDALLLTPMDAVGMASATFVAQNYGAGKTERLRRGVKVACCLGVAMTAVLVGIMLIFVRPAAALFNRDRNVIAYTVRIVTLIIPFYPICSINSIYASALRGCGYAKQSSCLIMLSYVLFRQVYLLVAKGAGNHFESIILVYPLGWVLSCALHGIWYHQRVLPEMKRTCE